MKENSAWQSCVGSVQQCYMDHKFVLMSLNLNCMRHSSHFAHFNPGPLMFHLRSEISGISGITRGAAKVSGAISGRLSSWDARYLKFRWSFSHQTDGSYRKSSAESNARTRVCAFQDRVKACSACLSDSEQV